ncbi:MAG: hypothetical protein PHX13_00770 [Thiovulaceae bacterium]|nr:hypothetical protein [Sulfurimonadaceae bacterium]
MKKFMSLLVGVTFFMGMGSTVLSAADMKSDANASESEKMQSALDKKMKSDANKKTPSKKSVKCGAGKCGDAK